MRDLAKRWNVPVEALGKKPVSAPEIFELCELGYVKLLWNICTNPAVSMVDRRRQLRTLNGVFLVVQDCFADTETAQLADNRIVAQHGGCGGAIALVRFVEGRQFRMPGGSWQ